LKNAHLTHDVSDQKKCFNNPIHTAHGTTTNFFTQFIEKLRSSSVVDFDNKLLNVLQKKLTNQTYDAFMCKDLD
jgi:hypothetical protein